jgi:hypothetical protein
VLPVKLSGQQWRERALESIREAASSAALVIPGRVADQIADYEREPQDVLFWLSDLSEYELDKGPEPCEHFADCMMFSVRIHEGTSHWGNICWYMHVSISSTDPAMVCVRSFKPDGSR